MSVENTGLSGDTPSPVGDDSSPETKTSHGCEHILLNF